MDMQIISELNKIKNINMKLYTLLYAVVFLSACGRSTDEVAKRAKETLQENNPSKIIDDIKLVHMEGNIYKGVIYYHYKYSDSTSDNNKTRLETDFQRDVEVLCDGNTIIATPADENHK